MKKNKLLAIILCVAMIATQFAMLGVSAAGTALTGRDDFLKGINVHPSLGYHAPYTDTYRIISDAKALGANIIRTNFNTQNNHAYDLGFAELANENGMKVWMTTSFSYFNEETGTPIPANEIDVSGITQKYTNAATILKDKIAYYQLGNEMNNRMHEGDENGLNASDYKDCSGIAVAIYAANKAIKEVDPNVKTVINFSWQNMGLIEAIKSVKLDAETGLPATDSTTNVVYADWDVIGLNWYSNGVNSDFKESGYLSDPIDYDYIIEQLEEKYPDKPVVVSEVGLWPKENADGSVGYIEDAQWLEDFLTYCYNNDHVIGFIPYELYDQDNRSYETGEYVFTTEAHHGLMKTDGTKRDVYNTICSLYGGTGEVDRTIPAVPSMSNKGELKAVFSTEGATGTVSTVYNGEDWVVAENTALDFSNGEMIEFDLYVEDAQALKSAMDRNGLNLMVKAYDTNGNYRDCRYITKEYIVNDGWNHISIPTSAFYDYSVDWTKINKIALQFFGAEDVIENYADISGMNIAIANICSTNIEAPENVVDNSKVVVDEVGYEVPAQRQVNYFKGENGKLFDAAIDISSCDRIEFDFYVENLELFKAITAEHELRLCLLGDTDGTKTKNFYLSKYVTKQGWNHIVINLADADSTSGTWNNKIKRYRLRYVGNGTDAIAHPATYFEFKNFNALYEEFNVVPEMIESEGMLVIHEGAKWSNTYDKVSDHMGTQINLGSGQDFSKYDYFEFDFYVENLDNLKALASKIRFNPCHSNGNSQLNFQFLDKLTKNGWNHVKVAMSEGGTTSYLTSLQYLRFRITKNSDVTVGATDRFKIANICATVDPINIIPEMIESEGMLTIHEGAKLSGTYGKLANNSPSNISDFGSNTDISNYSYIEFDYYVENLDSLKQLASEIRINPANSDTSGQLNYNFLDKLTQNGWNHVKIATSEFTGNGKFSSVRYIRFRIIKNDGITVADADRYKLANVCATLGEIDKVPEMIESEGMLVIHEGAKWSNTYDKVSDHMGTQINLGSGQDFSKYDYFEFDFYVENLDNLKALASKIRFNPCHSNGNSQLNFQFLDKLTKNGWNHVKVAMSEGGTTSYLTSLQYLRFRITKNSDVTVGATDRFKIANICATVDPINAVPEIVSNQITIHEGKKFSNKYGTPTATGVTKYPTAGDQNISVSTDKKDFSTGDYVEFDYFVDDVVALKEKLTGVHINIIASSNQNGSWVNFIDQITKNGWNHIKIGMDDLKNYGNGASLNMTNVQYVRFRVAFAESALNVEFADRYAIANVCVTADVKIPTEVMKDKIDFIGAEFKEIRFGAYGYSEDITADITGTKMIELDVYIEDDSNSTIGVELGDGSGEFAFYEFENLTNGWNHLAVRIADMEGADELNKANITNFALYGVEDTTVHVSNFYAADYVKGDGNRDGILDITDLVAMKKYSVGMTLASGMVGNKVAMDIVGNDYIVNAQDLSELRRYFMTDKWSVN